MLERFFVLFDVFTARNDLLYSNQKILLRCNATQTRNIILIINKNESVIILASMLSFERNQNNILYVSVFVNDK